MSRGAQPDYDDEARKLWSSLGLDALGQGVPARHSYNALARYSTFQYAAGGTARTRAIKSITHSRSLALSTVVINPY